MIQYLQGHVLIIFLIYMPRLVGGTAPEMPTWMWSHPKPHGNNIFEFVKYGDYLLQLCDSGKLYFSLNGEEWDLADTGTRNSLRSATVFNDALIIGAANGEILRTDDLVNFQKIQLSESDWIEGVASSRTQVVAVGDNGKIWASTDGVQWTSVPTITSNWLRSIYYTGNLFIAVGENGQLMTSFNGINWVSRNSGTSEHLNRISSLDNRHLIVGQNGIILSSSNGISWVAENSNVTDDLFNVALSNSGELIGGNSVALHKTSSTTSWSEIDQGLPDWVWLSSIYWNDAIYLGGRTGLTFQLPLNEENNSFINWGTFDNSLRNWIWDLEIAGGEFFAAGDFGTVMTSFRGVKWESLEVPNTVTNSFLMGLEYNKLGLAAVGTDGAIIFSPPISTNSYTTNIVDNKEVITTNLVSVNGRQFADVRPEGFDGDLQGITSFNDKFYASGDSGLILTSENGIDWQFVQTSQTAVLSSMANNGEVMVVVGSEGTTGYSSNGMDWSFVSSPTQNWLIRVRFVNGSFFASGQNGLLLKSNNGKSWKEIPAFNNNIWVQDIFHHQDVYYAVGTQGAMWWTRDLNQWNEMNLPTGKSLYTISGNSRRILVAGIEGIILRTLTESIFDPISLNHPRIISSLNQDNIGMALFGVTDQKFEVQSSIDLVNWDLVFKDRITDPDGLYLFLLDFLTDEADENSSFEFFRVNPLEDDSQ